MVTEMKDIIEQYARVYAKVDLDAICDNIRQMKSNIRKETGIIGVIKTDGYGHGAVPIARELEQMDEVFGYATATAEEALYLRKNGMKKPILVLGYTFPYSYESMILQDIRPAVFRYDMLKQLGEKAVELKREVSVHIKVDTGMSRVGIFPDEQGLAFVKTAFETPGIRVEGIFTHFARADEYDKTAALGQMNAFKHFCMEIEEKSGFSIPVKHCSNSAGIVELGEANMDVVRAGITLYGLWPSEEVSKNIISLKPALSLHSHVVYVKMVKEGTPVSYGGTFVTNRDTKIATIPVGYGDGYPRGLSGKGYVLIRGKKAPVLGRVCMDQFMVDVTEIEGASEGDEVTLIGTDNTETITMELLGELSGRFNYELACDLGKRIPRVYTKQGKIVAHENYFDGYQE